MKDGVTQVLNLGGTPKLMGNWLRLNPVQSNGNSSLNQEARYPKHKIGGKLGNVRFHQKTMPNSLDVLVDVKGG